MLVVGKKKVQEEIKKEQLHIISVCLRNEVLTGILGNSELSNTAATHVPVFF